MNIKVLFSSKVEGGGPPQGWHRDSDIIRAVSYGPSIVGLRYYFTSLLPIICYSVSMSHVDQTVWIHLVYQRAIL